MLFGTGRKGVVLLEQHYRQQSPHWLESRHFEHEKWNQWGYH